jgi:non-canonical poly(A) RNA polymerase PAPD5/7
VELLQRTQAVFDAWNGCPKGSELCAFGSFAAGFYLPNADMDLVLVSQSFANTGRKVIAQSRNQMMRIKDCLYNAGIAKPDSVEVIAGARVPLVKYVDRLTGIKVDMSFENSTGIVANDTFQNWKKQFPALPILATIVKQFLMMRGLNDVSTGGIGGFSITCLVVSMLQNMPDVRSGKVVPEDNLGEMLLEFLDLYGNKFERYTTAISMSEPHYVDKVISSLGMQRVMLTAESEWLTL